MTLIQYKLILVQICSKKPPKNNSSYLILSQKTLYFIILSLFCTTLALWLTSFPIIWNCLYVITTKILSLILCAFPFYRSVIRCLLLISIEVMLLAIWQCMDRDHNQA